MNLFAHSAVTRYEHFNVLSCLSTIKCTDMALLDLFIFYNDIF